MKLADLSYFNTGGSCEQFIAPHSLDEASELLSEVDCQAPYFILGAGSNSLVSDEPFPGPVIYLGKLLDQSIAGNALKLGAGVVNTAACELAFQEGLAGAGWMNRLPGLIGGTVRMNARCYGGEIKDICSGITTFRPGAGIVHYKEDDLGGLLRGYKDTAFMTNSEIVLGAEFQLSRADDLQPVAHLMERCATDRESKHQFDYPSCGCVFKNDYRSEVSVSSGLLLEMAGVKELTVGGAVISPYHANFIFNQGAGSEEILELSFLMREAVWQQFGVWLEYEMEVLGVVKKETKDRLLEKRRPEYQTSALLEAKRRFASR